MKTLSDLMAYYDQELIPILVELEAVRKQKVRSIFLLAGPFVVVGVILSLIFIQYGDIALAPVIIGGLIAAGIYAWQIKSYVHDFKDQIIAKIVKFVDESLTYDKHSYLPESDFQACKIYQRRPDRYKGDDRVRGQVGSTQIDFSEIHAQYVTRDSKGRTQTHTIFKGLFFKGDFNKYFHGETFVLPDKSEKLFGNFFQKMNVSRPPLVKLEDPEFEKLFVVYGTDQIESRYILSPALMKRITDFRNKTGRGIGLAFVRSCVYMTIPYSRNLFEPKVFQTLLNFSPIRQYFEDVAMAVGIVEDLNLNTRIWTKA